VSYERTSNPVLA